MELRRAADMMLRSQTSPLSTVLNPRTTLRWTNRAQLDHKCCSSRQTQRYLSTTSRRYAIKDIPTTTTAPQRSEKTPQSNPNSSLFPDSSSPGAQAPKDPLANLGATRGWTAPTTTRARPSYPLPRATGGLEKVLNGGSSASDLISGLIKARREGVRGGQSGGGVQVDRMLDPSPTNATLSSMMFDTAQETRIPKAKRMPIKLGPSTGRTITLGSAGVDIGRGFRLLEQSCARNKVKSDQTKQRFHERGGLKRKRLRRERWRRKFMDGFKAAVGRVKQLRNQGW